MLFRSDKKDAFNVMLAENEDGVYISLFNWDETNKKFDIEGFSNTKLIPKSTNSKYKLENNTLQITLKGHSSMILKIENTTFDILRKKIQLL